jgi:hypothetical protein
MQRPRELVEKASTHCPADLAGTVDRLRQAGVHLRGDRITGVGGKQAVIDDPSGNPIELFEPTRAEARLTNR